MKLQHEMTHLGLLGLTPFAIGAVAVWIAPYLIPRWAAMNVYQVVLIYGGVIAAYMAGAGAGALLISAKPAAERFLPGMIATLVAWVAIWPPVFFISMDAFWRCALLVGVLIYLLLRDLRATDADGMPNWYGALRIRLTLWASLFLSLIAVRMLLWGFV